MKKIDVVWVSANRFGLAALQVAARLPMVRLRAVITLGARATTVMYDGVPAAVWDTFGVPVHRVSHLRRAGALLRRLRPDLLVVCGWRQMLPERLLSIARLGTVGFHPTLLPHGRGSAPIIHTILSGATTGGVTLFHLGAGLDDGDIIGAQRFAVAPGDDAEAVYRKVLRAGRSLVRRWLPRLAAGTAPRRAQDEARATVNPRLPAEFNRLDPRRESLPEMYRKIRALAKPYRGAYLERNGQRLIIWRAELQSAAGSAPGGRPQ